MELLPVGPAEAEHKERVVGGLGSAMPAARAHAAPYPAVYGAPGANIIIISEPRDGVNASQWGCCRRVGG